MTCVDYSKGMLDSFAKKIKNKNYNVDLVEMDVTKLDLKKKYGLIFDQLKNDSAALISEPISFGQDRHGVPYRVYFFLPHLLFQLSF